MASQSIIDADWDYIIVGAGSAGCALAHRLAFQQSARVLLLEAGVDQRPISVKIPALVGSALNTYDWGYISDPDPTRHGASERWRRGRIVGGSSAINGMVYVRGAATDFDHWASLGNTGWSSSDVAPLFQEIERSDQSTPFRGQSGPLIVRTVKVIHEATKAFLASAAAAGYPTNPDYNGEEQEGVGLIQMNQRRGVRVSAADAFVSPLRRLSNFALLANTLVERVTLEHGRASGVEVRIAGQFHRIRGRDVILCAGAINSPKLLMQSGIGPADHLRRQGISVAADRKQVGRNLREHPLIRVVFRSRVPTYNLTGGPIQSLRFLFQYLLKGVGPIATPQEAVAFLRTDPALAAPDVQLHFAPIGLRNVSEHSNPILDHPSVTFVVNKSHPVGAGQVRLAGADPELAPIMEVNLAGASEDVSTLAAGIQLVRRIAGQEPLASLLGPEELPGIVVQAPHDLMEYVRRHTEITYHPAGTCRMGADADAVVDSKLRVNGVDNLWVADASIMPTLISGNTNAVCMMIGRKLGQHLLSRSNAQS
jgi:choline dehydrogenase